MIENYKDILRITSDSRIWTVGGFIGYCDVCGIVQKPVDQYFVAESDKIYASYQAYFQGDGAEQKIFKNGIGISRSRVILDTVIDHCGTSARAERPAKWLDMGCGAGFLLNAVSGCRPEWRLFGADIGDRYRDKIEAIPNIGGYWSDGIESLDGSFDYLSMIHVLEHIHDPISFLQRIRHLLSDDGFLVVVVPHYPDNPFDLLVADHCQHFSAATLEWLLRQCGFTVTLCSVEAINKEVMVIAQVDSSWSQECKVPTGLPGGNVVGALDWLLRVVTWGQTRSVDDTAIFGTALAATWLDSSMIRPFAFFVDEDPQRAGHSYLGRPVVLPSQVPSAQRVLVALPYHTAIAVCERLNQAHPKMFVPPPPVGEG